jgi:hypothetical protein
VWAYDGEEFIETVAAGWSGQNVRGYRTGGTDLPRCGSTRRTCHQAIDGPARVPLIEMPPASKICR